MLSFHVFLFSWLSHQVRFVALNVKDEIRVKNFTRKQLLFSFKFNVIKHLNGVHDIVFLFYLICVLVHQKFAVNTRSISISKFFMTGFEYKKLWPYLTRGSQTIHATFITLELFCIFLRYENRKCMN